MRESPVWVSFWVRPGCWDCACAGGARALRWSQPFSSPSRVVSDVCRPPTLHEAICAARPFQLGPTCPLLVHGCPPWHHTSSHKDPLPHSELSIKFSSSSAIHHLVYAPMEWLLGLYMQNSSIKPERGEVVKLNWTYCLRTFRSLIGPSVVLHNLQFLVSQSLASLPHASSHCCSLQAARGVVGRLMADPAFMQKLVIEEFVTAALSVLYESQQRGDRFLKELDLVALNTVSLMGATGAMVWMTSPNRSYGAVHKFPWQNALHNLPNHMFDASTPYRRFSLASRAGSLLAKVSTIYTLNSGELYCM